MIVAWRAVAMGHPQTAHGAIEAEETMSRIRTVLRSAIVLGVVAAGVSALDLLLATPAAAWCFGYGCGYRYHARPAYPAYFRRAAMPHWSMAPWQRPHGASVQTNPTASTSSSHGCKQCRQRNPNAATVSPHGPAGGANPSGASFSPYGSGGGGGGYGAGGGGGSGQYTTSGYPGSSSGNRPSQTAPTGTGASTTGAPGGSAATKPASNPVLTAVAACVTPKGSCPMQRDLGTACQCKDQQGNLYDGIMK
jgi:uncharacterized membrane protein YgcG